MSAFTTTADSVRDNELGIRLTRNTRIHPTPIVPLPKLEELGNVDLSIAVYAMSVPDLEILVECSMGRLSCDSRYLISIHWDGSRCME